MRAVGTASFTQRADEVRLGPAPDAGLRMRRDVRPVKRAERRLQRATAGIGRRLLLFLGMAAEAAARLRKVLAALGSPCAKTGAAEKAKAPRSRGLPGTSPAYCFCGSRGSRRSLADRLVLLLDARLVLRARRLAELCRFGLQALRVARRTWPSAPISQAARGSSRPWCSRGIRPRASAPGSRGTWRCAKRRRRCRALSPKPCRRSGRSTFEGS